LRLLDGFYGRDTERGRIIGGLEPDLLGEKLASETIAAHTDILALALDGISEDRAYNALTVFNRRAQRQPFDRTLIEKALEDRLAQLAKIVVSVAVESGVTIGLVAKNLLQLHSSKNLDAAKALTRACPSEIVPSILEMAYAAMSIVIDYYDEKSPPLKWEDRAELARLLRKRGNYLLKSGYTNAAGKDLKRSAQIYSRLSGILVEQVVDSIYLKDDLKEGLEDLMQIINGRGHNSEAFVPDLALALKDLVW
jgi:hypothetical protein